MIVNGYTINVFDPKFALTRIYEDADFRSNEDITLLQEITNRYETPDRSYHTGDTILYRERDYHKYHANLAVMFEIGEVFHLQTFHNGKVGEHYFNIKKHKDDIAEFFNEAKGDLLVIDNRFATELKGDIDLLLNYIDCVTNARRQYEKHQRCVDSYMQKYNTLIDLTQQCDSLFLEKIEILSEKFIDTMVCNISKINTETDEKLKAYCNPLAKQEALCIAFGLYYCFLKKGITAKARLRDATQFSAFLYEMHSFLCKYPTLVDDYCDYMDYPDFERNTVKNILHKEGLDRERWIFAADDLL